MITLKRLVTGFVLCGVVVLAAGSWFALAASGQKSDSATEERWEYLVVGGGNVSLVPTGSPGQGKQKVFRNESTVVERNLDVLGKEGWELVSVGGTPNEPAFFLKRPEKNR